MSQEYERAHLRPLPVCPVCAKPATHELWTGLNAMIDRYCERHAKRALEIFKATKIGG